MSLQETGIRITPDAVLSHNASGEVLNTYVRHVSPLDLWRRNGLRETEYQAGQRYGALWRQVCKPRSPSHTDTTRIIVDGGGAAPEWLDNLDRGASVDDLASAQKAIGPEESVTFLNRLCGQEDWPAGDKRRFKRICRKGLERLAQHWRRR